MILKLENKRENVAVSIREVFQRSYAVEAELLGVMRDDFPPLNRSLNEFIQTETKFYGYALDSQIAGVIELKIEKERIHIQSLVIDPQFFRKGIASKLLSFSFENFESDTFYVETGAANDPAIALYQKHGFKLITSFLTEVGIEKVAFEKKVN